MRLLFEFEHLQKSQLTRKFSGNSWFGFLNLLTDNLAVNYEIWIMVINARRTTKVPFTNLIFGLTPELTTAHVRVFGATFVWRPALYFHSCCCRAVPMTNFALFVNPIINGGKLIQELSTNCD